MSNDEEFDQYGNPVSGDRLIYCCFPACGCDGSRLCMAAKGANDRACSQNVEGMWRNGSKPECLKAVFALVRSLNDEAKS